MMVNVAGHYVIPFDYKGPLVYNANGKKVRHLEKSILNTYRQLKEGQVLGWNGVFPKFKTIMLLRPNRF